MGGKNRRCPDNNLENYVLSSPQCCKDKFVPGIMDFRRDNKTNLPFFLCSLHSYPSTASVIGSYFLRSRLIFRPTTSGNRAEDITPASICGRMANTAFFVI